MNKLSSNEENYIKLIYIKKDTITLLSNVKDYTKYYQVTSVYLFIYLYTAFLHTGPSKWLKHYCSFLLFILTTIS